MDKQNVYYIYLPISCDFCFCFFFYPQISNCEHIQLCVITYISLNHPCANFYTNTKIWILQIFSNFLHAMQRIILFCPNFRPIQLKIIHYILYDYCAKFYTNTQTNMDTIIFSNFSRFFFSINSTTCIYSKISYLGHMKPYIISNIFCKVFEYPMQIYTLVDPQM